MMMTASVSSHLERVAHTAKKLRAESIRSLVWPTSKGEGNESAALPSLVGLPAVLLHVALFNVP